MLMPTQKKPNPRLVPPSFKEAAARWAKADAKRTALVESHEGMELALNYARHGVDTRVPKEIRAKAEPYAGLANGHPRKLAAEIDSVSYEIAENNETYGDEREKYQAAARVETARIAQALQPRHRVAVKAIAKALEDLSRALEAEADIRAELAHTAPEATSAYLPDCSSFLSFGSLAAWDSPASVWAREMRRLKILE